MINEKTYKESLEIVNAYEQQQLNLKINNALPSLEDDLIMEYKDLFGMWHEYTQDILSSPYFIPPLITRVRKKTYLALI